LLLEAREIQTGLREGRRTRRFLNLGCKHEVQKRTGKEGIDQRELKVKSGYSVREATSLTPTSKNPTDTGRENKKI